MIKICISKLSPEGMKISGEVASDFLDLKSEEDIYSIGPVCYELNVQLVHDGVLVSGQLNTTLICRCANCLEEYEMHIKNSEICHFYEMPNKNEIDLTDDIREDILLSFPLNLKCSENCKGLCLKCGQNLNINSCLCKDDKQENSWNELDELKF